MFFPFQCYKLCYASLRGIIFIDKNIHDENKYFANATDGNFNDDFYGV